MTATLAAITSQHQLPEWYTARTLSRGSLAMPRRPSPRALLAGGRGCGKTITVQRWMEAYGRALADAGVWGRLW